MKHFTLKTTLLLAAALAVNGCTQNEAVLAQTLANSAVGAAGKGTSTGMAMNAGTLSSSAAMSGMAQSQVIGAQMMMNPAMLGLGAVGMISDAYNAKQKRESFGKITDLAVNADGVNAQMEAMMLKTYNEKHGTHYTSMAALQRDMKVKGYNKKYGTSFRSLDEVREDYNKRHGTHYTNNADLLKAIRRR